MKLPPLRGLARAYLMAIAFWCGFSILMGLQYIPFDRQNPRAWVQKLLAGAVLRGAVLGFWTPPIFYVVRKYLSISRSRIRYALVWIFGVVPFVLLHIFILLVLLPPYDEFLQKHVPRSFHLYLEMLRTSFADEVFIYIAILVAAHAFEYFRRMRTQERERYEYQQALTASELQALKMQLHPHFLFNTLHGIATLVGSDPKTAEAMIVKLSGLLRISLDRDSSDLIPLEDELKFVGGYLDLEKMRFGSRLNIEWAVAPETRRLLVPQMILQPLVENAIRHGIASSREAGWIEIATSEENGKLTIRLRNSVGGKTSNGTGVGLRNAEARLKYLYSGDASIGLTVAEDRSASVNLILPALNSQPGDVQGRRAQNVIEKEDPSCAF